jgi:soluble cytochrome b562
MDASTLVIVAVSAAVIAVAVIIILTMVSRSSGHSDITDDQLKRLEKADPMWKKETMLGTVQNTFDTLKKSYETRKSEVQTDMLTINIYRDLFKNVMPNLEKLAFIKQTSLKNAEIIQVVSNPKVESQNSFTVKMHLDGSAEEDPTMMFWTFIKVSNKWLLSEISQNPVNPGFFHRSR